MVDSKDIVNNIDMTQFGVDPATAKMYQGNMSHGERLKSTFKSTDLNNKGKIFGIEVDPGTANVANILLFQALPELVDYTSKHATRVAQSFANAFITKDPKQALEFGKKYGKALPYGVIFAKPAAELGITAYNTSHRLYELRNALSIILKANGELNLGAGIFSDANNEVIHNARQKILTSAKNDLIRNVTTNGIAIAPNFMRLQSMEAAKLKEDMSKAELEYLAKHGTAEDIEEYTKNRLKSAFKSEGTGRSVLNEQKKIQEKEYEEGFKTFKKDRENSKKASKALDEAIKEDRLAEFKAELDLGPAVDGESKKTTGFAGNSSQTKDLPRDQRKKIEERWLKYEYGRQNGAWDEKWMSGEERKQIRAGGGKIETRSSLLDEIFKKELDLVNGVKSKEDKALSDETMTKTVNHMVQLLAGVAATTVSNIVTGGTDKKLKDKLALDMILNMRRSLDENAQRDTIPGSGDDSKSQEYSFAHYVHKIFQEHQHDCGQSEINDHYASHLRSVNWSDEAIQKMKDSDLTPYEVAIKHMSQLIHDGRMDALALINLVGERKIVQRSGKSFGILKSGTDDEVCAGILAEIDKQASLLKPNHKMNEEEISEALANYTFSKEELQAAFKPGVLDTDARTFLFTLVDMNTPDHDVVKDLTGLSETEVKNLRAHSQEQFTREFDAALREILADISAHPEAAPTKYHLTEEQVQHFAKLNTQAHETDASLDGLLTAENRKQVAATVANVIIDDKMHHDSNFWRNKIKPHAQESKLRDDEEAQIKRQEKMAIENQDYGAQNEPEGFVNRVASESSQTSRLQNQPFVSKRMQNEFSNPAMLSHAHKATRHHSHSELGQGA